mmetsp:Transcript_11163/g.15987  ORF Transcript_11163/g.15987 Transcript_11163/m.15987 type:complete len:97 (+) Transcript_11163:154-444(+)
MLVFSLAIATGFVKHEPKNWKIESFDHIYNSYTVSACTIELKVSSRGAVPRRACCSSASTRAPSLCDRTATHASRSAAAILLSRSASAFVLVYVHV